MTVGELAQALRHVPDDLEVLIEDECCVCSNPATEAYDVQRDGDSHVFVICG